MERSAIGLWCILRMAPSRTLSVARSLCETGIIAWTPRRTFKRVKPGRRNLIDGRPATVEIDAPILPTFVFAPADAAVELEALASNPASRHPPFSVLHHAGRIPFVSDRAIEGLRQEEARAADLLEQLRDAESRQERRRLRAAAAKTEHERRKALRSERRPFAAGQVVNVELDAFAGMTGVVESSDGRSAVVVFGGSLTMKIEAWRLSSLGVRDGQLAMSAAA